MNDINVIHLASEILFVVLMLSMPVVLVAAIVGVLVSLLQALTQVQDQTLQFLVKLIAVSITLMLTYHWMGSTLLNYAQMSFSQISHVGRST